MIDTIQAKLGPNELLANIITENIYLKQYITHTLVTRYDSF